MKSRMYRMFVGFICLTSFTVPFSAAASASSEAYAHPRLGKHLHELTMGLNPCVLFLGTHGASAISHNCGRTWSRIPALNGIDAMEATMSPNGRIIGVAGHVGARMSFDGGVTWKNVSQTLPANDVHGFGFDLKNPQRLVAYVVGHGVYESRDDGGHWTPLAPLPEANPMSMMAMTMGDIVVQGNRIMLPGMAAGIYVSVDDGKTWRVEGTHVIGMNLHASPGNPRRLVYSGMPETGMFVSADGGHTWKNYPLPLGALVAGPLSGNTLYAAGYDNLRPYLWRSGDDGHTWKRVALPWTGTW